MENLVLIGLIMPLIGSLIILLGSFKFSEKLTTFIGCSSIVLSFICFLSLVVLYVQDGMNPFTVTVFNWLPMEFIKTDVSFHVDSLSLLMTLIITGVGSIIHLYSTGYMHEDSSICRYFASMNFFVFAMLILVLASNLLVLFVGWEGVGLASYLLIGFWHKKPSAAQAATKAFVMNRIGDFGLLLGIILTYSLFHTVEIQQVLQLSNELYTKSAPIITVLTLLYFVGAIGKSAQFPLHTWLPDAMEGPTPVSALIHAATMVTAGVYLIVRMHDIFLLAPLTLQIVGIVGAGTSLFASICAMGQTDLKKVLAYSTVSQLGLMFVAAGAGAFYIAMFHLTTHAFMKSLLFLSAGNVLHVLHGQTEMHEMGGLSKKMKITNGLFLIGVLAMAGIPPFAAFFSKDMILEQEYLAGFEILFYVSLAASILTGVYLIRAYCYTFLGKTHVPQATYEKLKDVPKIMYVPVFLLGFLSIVGGFLGFSEGHVPILASFLNQIGINPIEQKLSTHFALTPESTFTIVSVLVGCGLAAIIYTRYAGQIGSNQKSVKNAFYVDDIYEWIIVKPLKYAATLIARVIEPQVIDQFILGVGQTTEGVAGKMQLLQSGQIRSSIAWMILGAVVLFLYFFF